ncbi:MAG: hypothetical protein ACFE8U_16760 [Candidatus Hermodarchaeota archaeon]
MAKARKYRIGLIIPLIIALSFTTGSKVTSQESYSIFRETDSNIWMIKLDAFGTPEWNQSFGGEHFEMGTSVLQTIDGGYMLVGSDRDDDFVIMIKTNASGSLEWYKFIQTHDSEPRSSELLAILPAKDRGFLVGGMLREQMWLMKMTITGGILWDKRYEFDPFGRDRLISIIHSTDGGMAFVGCIGDDILGSYNMSLIKTDSDGNMVWNRTYRPTDRTRTGGNAILQTNDEGFLLAGVAGSCSEVCVTYLVKTNASGIMIWNQRYDVLDQGIAYSIVEAADGGYFVAGENYVRDRSFDMSLFKTDINGNLEWYTSYGGDGVDGARKILDIGENAYLIAGNTESYGIGGSDMYLVKIANDGTVEWEKTYGSEGDDEAINAIKTSDGGVMLIGYCSGSPSYELNFHKNDPIETIQSIPPVYDSAIFSRVVLFVFVISFLIISLFIARRTKPLK